MTVSLVGLTHRPFDRQVTEFFADLFEFILLARKTLLRDRPQRQMLHRLASLSRIRSASFTDLIERLFFHQLNQRLGSLQRFILPVVKLEPRFGNRHSLVFRVALLNTLQTFFHQLLTGVFFANRIDQAQQFALHDWLGFGLFAVIRDRLTVNAVVILWLPISIIAGDSNL